MWYGWTGYNLEVDLSQGNIERYEGNLSSYSKYLGGRGIGSKILWDKVSPETDPFSEENLLVFSAGPLTGTQVPGANRTILTTRSPINRLQTYSAMGGFWAAELKHAGYDNLIISGKSSEPVYLWVKDKQIKIRDAKHLWGKNVQETQKLIREELKDYNIQVICIGPAGENKVYAASIEHGQGASLSRTGVGAVMGDKFLKAIAVHGTQDVHIARPTELINLCQKILKKSDILKKNVDNWSYERAPGLLSVMAYGYMGENVPFKDAGNRHAKFLEEYSPRKTPCYNCRLNCVKTLQLPDGQICHMKCQSYITFMAACKIQDFTFSLKAFNLCQKYGLDHISTANYVAFAIDCYEKGMITKKETDGLHLEWGNADLALLLIEKIAKREGIGDILANGLHAAAQLLLGEGGEKFVYHVKKHEMLTANPYRPYHALASAIPDKPDYSRVESAIPNYWLEGKSKEIRQEYVNSEFFPYPEELKKPFLDDFDYAGRDYERLVKMTSFDVDKNAIADCSGICIYWLGFWAYQPIQLADHIQLISYATGIDLDEDKIFKVAKRAGMLIRAYNAILGIRKKNETIPDRYFTKDPPPPFVRFDRERFERMVQAYYQQRGFNNEGVPTKETLDELNLQDVREELERRGII